jgi:hypothetical protein
MRDEFHEKYFENSDEGYYKASIRALSRSFPQK